MAGANRHDKKLLEPTLEAIHVDRPNPSRRKPQHMCLDKGYDYPDIRELVDEWGFKEHIKTRGIEASEKKRIPGYRARRWVVERTHSWLNRFRKILIRWEKKVTNHLALIQLACAYITARRIDMP